MFQPKLLAHLNTMQGAMRAYLLPEPYREQFPPFGAVEDHGTPGRDALFAADMIYALDGPEQREAQAEAEFDYVAETDVTASNVYGGFNSDASLLRRDLATFIEAANRLDQHKKVLFRKRSNEDAGLPQPGQYRTSDRFDGPDAELLHGIIGVATEAGELAEIAHKRLSGMATGEPFDVTNVREEIGDILWYLARLMKWAGTSFLAEMQRNIAKLRERHGASFNAERDANRDLTAERLVLENGSVVGLSESEPITGRETFDAEEVAAGQAHSSHRVNTQVRDFPDEMISGVDPAAGKLSDQT